MTVSLFDIVGPEFFTKQKAIVVGIDDSTQKNIEYDSDEIQALLTTLGVETLGVISQKRRKMDPRYGIGSGKVDEVKEVLLEKCASIVVVDQALTPPQQNNLQASFDCLVLDRTGVILEIFRQHARTNQAKTQVEIARLEYLLPRMVGAWTHLERQSGGGGGGGAFNRGMGEKQVEVDRRRARERIHRLKAKLKHFSGDRIVQRRQRQREFTVALVGYTNSGKSSLMNALTESEVLVADKLFASLDAKVKTIDHHARPRVLLIDTVGFIKNLPHSLVESFRSTLEEALTADLLINVIDCSNDHYREHMEVTEEVLETIGADKIPQFTVFNKGDLIDDERFGKILAKGSHSFFLSARDADDVSMLRESIDQYFLQNFQTLYLELDPGDDTVVSYLSRNCIIKTQELRIDKMFYEVLINKDYVKNLERLVSNHERCSISPQNPS